jgi:hypothetical protein
MTTRGVEGLILETHNWGKAVAFWTDLGYKVEFETDHHSGQLRHPAGGAYLFIVERPEGEPLEMQPLIGVDDATTFAAPSTGQIDSAFEPRHWNAVEMLLLDPDGRRLSLQAPLPDGVDPPVGREG